MGGTLILFSLTLATLLLADLTNPYVLAGAPRHRRLRRHRLRRRLPQGLAAATREGLPGAPVIAEFVIGGDRGTLLYPAGPSTAARDHAVLQGTAARPRAALHPVRRLVIVGASNAVNLTDGLDGLAIGPVMIAAGTYLVFAYVAGQRALRRVPADPLRRRRRRAGDLLRRARGRRPRLSLVQRLSRADVHGRRRLAALGAALGVVALVTKQELVLLLVGGVFVVEALSVIAQVASFKLPAQAHLPDGADPSPLRAQGLARAADHRALLDHLDHLRAARALAR